MAPRLPPSKLHLIRDMIESQSLTTSQVAEEADCSKPTIKNIRRTLRQFGSVYAPMVVFPWLLARGLRSRRTKNHVYGKLVIFLTTLNIMNALHRETKGLENIESYMDQNR